MEKSTQGAYAFASKCRLGNGYADITPILMLFFDYFGVLQANSPFCDCMLLFCGFLRFETVEFVLFEFQIHPLDRRADCKQELCKREEFGRIDEFALMLQAPDHTFCNVLRLLHGERTLADDFAFLPFHCFLKKPVSVAIG